MPEGPCRRGLPRHARARPRRSRAGQPRACRRGRAGRGLRQRRLDGGRVLQRAQRENGRLPCHLKVAGVHPGVWRAVRGEASNVEPLHVPVAGKDVDVIEHAQGKVPVLAVGVPAPEYLLGGVLEQKGDGVSARGHDAHADGEAILTAGAHHVEKVSVVPGGESQVVLSGVDGVVAFDAARPRVAGGEELPHGVDEELGSRPCVARGLGERAAAGVGVTVHGPARRRVHVHGLADVVVRRPVQIALHGGPSLGLSRTSRPRAPTRPRVRCLLHMNAADPGRSGRPGPAALRSFAPILPADAGSWRGVATGPDRPRRSGPPHGRW